MTTETDAEVRLRLKRMGRTYNPRASGEGLDAWLAYWRMAPRESR